MCVSSSRKGVCMECRHVTLVMWYSSLEAVVSGTVCVGGVCSTV